MNTQVQCKRSADAMPFATRSLIVTMAVALLGLFAGPESATADSYVKVTGSGSTWSQVAIDAWRSDVNKNGIAIDYNGNGSTAGRLDFIAGLNDFGVSEIPFQLHPEDGSSPEISPRPYAYLPIVAGGTSFMYHLTVAGHRVTDLRLSGTTLTKIFTGVINNWADPAVTADYGRALPSEPITPVIRSDGSGTSAQFTLYMSKQYSSLWNAFCVKYAHATPPCGLYSFYPGFPGSKAQTGSNGVADYVAASYGEGSIGFVEYAYALNLGFPVAKILNAAGYFTAPTASNVGVALTKAGINADLTQNLDGVYANPDRRTYPLSSYSYMIVPTDTHAPFTTDMGKTLSTYIDYFLCAGQQKAAALGYSPLPLNLVQAGFAQVHKIPGNIGTPDGTQLANCHNPTFEGGTNVLLRDAPYPAACDRLGAAPCGAPGTSTNGTHPTTTPNTGTAGSTGGATSTRAAGAAGSSAGNGGRTPGGTSFNTPGAVRSAGPVDPVTGLAAGPESATATGSLLGTSTAVAASRPDAQHLLEGLAAFELLLALAIPPALAAYLRRRRRGAA